MALFIFGCLWIIAMIYKGYKHDVWNKESKKQAIKEGKDYYIDSNLNYRKTIDDRPFIQITKNNELIERDLTNDKEINLTRKMSNEYSCEEYKQAIKEGRDIFKYGNSSCKVYDTIGKEIKIEGNKYGSINNKEAYVIRWMGEYDLPDNGRALKEKLNIKYLPVKIPLFMRLSDGKFIRVAFLDEDKKDMEMYNKNIINQFVKELNEIQNNYFMSNNKIDYKNTKANINYENKYIDKILFSKNI